MNTADLSGRTEATEGLGGRLFVDVPTAEGGRLYDAPWTDDARLLRLWSTPLDRMSALAREVGARLLVVIPPDAHAVHEAQLPAHRPLARPTVGERFASLLGPHAEVLHLEAALCGAKGAVDPYRPTDSHWSAPGAYVGYRRVMAKLAGTGARVLQPEDLAFAWAEEAGDLGATCDPPRRTPTPRTVVRAPRVRNTDDRSNHRRHAYKLTEVDDPSLPTAVIFRDSFVTEMAPFLVEGFRRAVLVGAEGRGFPDLVRDERPDVILFERAERGLPTGLADWELTGWREHWPDPGCGPREADAARAERAAARALDEGRAEPAAASAREACELGDTPDRRFTLGRALLAAGSADDAAAELTLALAAAPSRWSFALHMGVARLAQGRTAEARDLFGRACALAPWHPRVFEHFGYASLALADATAARPALEHAVRIGPELAGSWIWLMQALERLGDAEALERVRREARAAPVDIPGLDG